MKPLSYYRLQIKNSEVLVDVLLNCSLYFHQIYVESTVKIVKFNDINVFYKEITVRPSDSSNNINLNYFLN